MSHRLEGIKFNNHNGFPGSLPLVPGTFEARVIDNDAHALRESFALRYQVYCLERGFLRPENYPLGLETDRFDNSSIHIGAFDADGTLVGTVRLVRASEAGFPLFDHCQVYPGKAELPQRHRRIVEVSRLAVSRRIRRSRGINALVRTLYKALYQTSKRHHVTHWLAATEPSFQRLVADFGCPFTPIGPETDYFGPVTPYFMDMSEWDAIIASGAFPALASFPDGLDPEMDPRRRVLAVA